MKKLGCKMCGGTKKMRDGGTNENTSPHLERLTKKITKKTTIGKPVSNSLTKRYDKAVDKVIVSGMKKNYATGGPINKPMTYAKAQKGDTNQGMGIFGAPQIGQGAMDGKTGQMKKGGLVKSKATKFAKGGSTFGMLSVKAGIDKNPKPTAADRIAGAKKTKKK
jgi:hypothetical protein